MTAEELRNIKPGPIQHRDVPPFLLDIMQWTYKIVGHYVQPTLEQWELGFMRDVHIEQEVAYWVRLAHAFISYHERRKLPLRSDDEELRLVGSFMQRPVGTDHESALIRDCWKNPERWKEEAENVDKLAGDPNPHWTPLPGYENWPN
jgi:hypothetical protein